MLDALSPDAAELSRKLLATSARRIAYFMDLRIPLRRRPIGSAARPTVEGTRGRAVLGSYLLVQSAFCLVLSSAWLFSLRASGRNDAARLRRVHCAGIATGVVRMGSREVSWLLDFVTFKHRQTQFGRQLSRSRCATAHVTNCTACDRADLGRFGRSPFEPTRPHLTSRRGAELSKYSSARVLTASR